MQTASYKNDAKNSADKAANTMSEFKNRVEDAAVDAKDNIQDIAYDAGRKVRNFFSSCKNEISDTTDTVTQSIRNKPVQSSLIALGAGFILASLLRR